jgi:opacity protein-like surface antigen
MRTLCSLVLVTFFLTLAAERAAAQPRVPDSGMTALSASFGWFLPGDDLDNAVTLGAALDHYLTPRAGVRATVGWVNPALTAASGTLRQIRLTGDLTYNWEGAQWHPFVVAGVGAYVHQRRVGGRAVGSRETRLGLNLGGGLEYFITRTVAIKGEALYHFVPRGDLPWTASGVALTLGLKTYF